MKTFLILLFASQFLISCSRPKRLKDFSYTGASAVTIVNLTQEGSDYSSPANCRYLGPAKIAGDGYQQNFSSQEFNLREKIFSYGANRGVIRDYTDHMAYVELYFCSADYE
jgi:hypothetical protein